MTLFTIWDRSGSTLTSTLCDKALISSFFSLGSSDNTPNPWILGRRECYKKLVENLEDTLQLPSKYSKPLEQVDPGVFNGAYTVTLDMFDDFADSDDLPYHHQHEFLNVITLLRTLHSQPQNFDPLPVFDLVVVGTHRAGHYEMSKYLDQG